MLFWWSFDLSESKHKSHVLFRSGLHYTTAELHGEAIGRCKVVSRKTKIATSPAKLFSFRKVLEVSLCGILFILLVGLAYYILMCKISILPKTAAPSMLKCILRITGKIT